MNLGIDYLVGRCRWSAISSMPGGNRIRRNVELAEQARHRFGKRSPRGRIKRLAFCGIDNLLLAGLAMGAAAVSFYLLLLIASQFSQVS